MITGEKCFRCGTFHAGMYCHVCGTVHSAARDFSLWGFYKNIFYNISSLGSNFIDGVRDLCIPGKVTRDFLSGDTRDHIKPVQLFGVVNLFFYLVLFNVSVFYTRIDDMAVGYENWPSANNYFQFNISKRINDFSEQFVLDNKSVNITIEANAASLSKALLIILVPFWGFLIFWIVRDKIYLKSHVLAMNSLSFYMLVGMVYIFTLFYFKSGYLTDFLLLPFHIVFGIYLWISIKRVFETNFIRTTIYTFTSLLAFFFLISIYRQFTLMLAVWLFKKEAYLDIFQYKVPLVIIGSLILKYIFDKYRAKRMSDS